ncbi:unnamed protein product [Penicillium olsonii]|nr:unnamed protein product [Penicillium olsonii]
MIVTMLLDETRPASPMELYFARCLGFSLLTIAVLTVMLTGSIPLTADIKESVSTDESDPKAPYAVPTLMVTSVFHSACAFYAYTWYVSGGQGLFAIGVAGYSGLAAIGLWCMLFASSNGRISRRTGADKRTTGYPFKNSEAAKKHGGKSSQPHNAASAATSPFQKQHPLPTTLIFLFVATWAIAILSMTEPNLSHMVPFDEGSHNFIAYRPAETRPRTTRHANTFIRPGLPGEAVHDFVIAAQPNHHQSHQPGNDSSQFQQGRPPNRDSLQQRRDYGDDFENGQLLNASAGSFHGSGAGQMLPPASLSQNGLAMVNHAHPAHNDGFSMLQSPTQAFQQEFVEMNTDPVDPTALVAPGELRGFKAIPDPPNLDYWRERLFNVDELITLSEDEFNTYFPHVDNVYSHRSTQRYKRKPFVSHYWDCRLKGRPPGTPKSDNPEKKKRKRTARERDLCHVKIKVMEYFPRSELLDVDQSVEAGPSSVPGMYTFSLGGDPAIRNVQTFGMLPTNTGLPPSHPGANGGRYYTIQRVNGNGANGKDDGISGGHQHTLEESDRVKKSSVQRSVMKDKKDRRTRVDRVMSQPDPKTYHTKATGLAADTVVKHSEEVNLKLYGSCFCPFVQRVWIALELKGIPYQYIEVDPYQKPASLLEVNPRGLVPALRHDNWGCYESNVLLEYLEDLGVGAAMLPADPKLRAHCRLWADHVNRHLVPGFYRVLQEQDQQGQLEKAQELRVSMEQLLEVAHSTGPFFMGPQMSLVDIQAAPWILRLRRVLKPYRGWPDPDQGSRLAAWVDAIETDPHVQATTSTDDLYLDSYERYAREFARVVFFLKGVAGVLMLPILQKTARTRHSSPMRSTQDEVCPEL